MNGTTLERPDVAAYLDAVRSRLADLPAEERDDLVADVEASLLESGETPVLSPEEFAAELREAAGLAPEAAPAAQASLLESLRSWLSSERAATWGRTARELAPIWWLARAYVFVVLLDAVGGLSFELTVVTLVAAAAFSVWLGLRGRRERSSRPRLVLAANVALALALLPVAVHSLDQLSPRLYAGPVAVAQPQPGLAVDGIPIQNIYPYSRDGKPLFDVLLYSDYGLPLDLPDQGDPWRRVLVDEAGVQHFNAFPVRYYEPGTKTVARPELAPEIAVPKIATPALELPSK